MELENLLKKVVERLQKTKIPYMLTGGLAVSIWGRPRSTLDLDIVINLKKVDEEKIYDVLHQDFYINLDEVKLAADKSTSFNIIDRDNGEKIDFYLVHDGEYEKLRFQRRVNKKLLGISISVISPEDLILVKLRWYKDSGSTRHLEDAESIIKISGDKLDKKYLNSWSKKLGVADILISLYKK